MNKTVLFPTDKDGRTFDTVDKLRSLYANLSYEINGVNIFLSYKFPCKNVDGNFPYAWRRRKLKDLRG